MLYYYLVFLIFFDTIIRMLCYPFLFFHLYFHLYFPVYLLLWGCVSVRACVRTYAGETGCAARQGNKQSYNDNDNENDSEQDKVIQHTNIPTRLMFRVFVSNATQSKAPGLDWPGVKVG